MKNSRFRSAAWTLVALAATLVLAGCATDNKARTESLSSEEFRRLYPRQYYESASPSERQELERQERERQRREANKR